MSTDVCGSAYVCGLTDACWGWGAALGVISRKAFTWFFEIVSYLDLELTDGLGWPAGEPQGPSVSTSPALRLQAHATKVNFLRWVLGI